MSYRLRGPSWGQKQRASGVPARRAGLASSSILVLALAARLSSAAVRDDLNAPAPERLADGVYLVRLAAPAVADAAPAGVANAGFVVGPTGVVVIGSGASARDGATILRAVRRVTTRPVRMLVLTHAGQETVFGAAAFQEAGIPVVMHCRAAALMAARCEQCLARLERTQGQAAMAGTRLVTPDRLVTGAVRVTTIGRTLRLLAPSQTSSIGWLAVLDTRSGTLFAGSLAAVARVPDLRDTDGAGWPDALDELARTRCRRLVPALGRTGSCDDLDDARHYFAAIEARARRLVREDVALGEARDRGELPQFAAWDAYGALHAQNVQRAYLRLERSEFIH